MKKASTLLALMLLIPLLSACSGREGSKCAKDSDCGSGLACLTPAVAAKTELPGFTCQTPEVVAESKYQKVHKRLEKRARERAEAEQ